MSATAIHHAMAFHGHASSRAPRGAPSGLPLPCARKLANGLPSLLLATVLIACGAPQRRPVSPVNAAEEVAREVDDADPHAPAEERSPNQPEEKAPSDESGD